MVKLLIFLFLTMLQNLPLITGNNFFEDAKVIVMDIIKFLVFFFNSEGCLLFMFLVSLS